MAVLDDRTVLIRQHAFGNGEAIGKDPRLLDAPGERAIEDDDLIAGLGFIKRFGGGGVLISIHRILQGGARPSPSLLVEDEHDELSNLRSFLSEELDFETLWQTEEFLLFLRRTPQALHIVIASILLLRGFRGLSWRRGL